MTRTLIAEPVPQTTAAQCCAPVAAGTIDRSEADTLATVFKALADPNRVLIVNVLANAPGPVCVCDITAHLGLAQGTVSFHLKKLLAAGLLQREQRGTWAYYSPDRPAMRRLDGIFRDERRDERSVAP